MKNILIYVSIIILVLIIIFTITSHMKSTCYEELTIFKNYYYTEGFNDAVNYVYNLLSICEQVPIKVNNNSNIIYAINYDCLLKE